MDKESDNPIIPFKNQPFTARVWDLGNGSIVCTPVIINSESHCGIGVFNESGNGTVWGPVIPRNLITAWRGTEVLRHLDTIGFGTLCNAYYTGGRNPRESDKKQYIDPIIEKIGQTVYDGIMILLVPEEIIRAILDNQSGQLKPNICEITDEVRAGTIKWRQEFVDAGIEHPHVVDTRRRAQNETIAKFEDLLISYGESCNLPRECLGMSSIEGALLKIVAWATKMDFPDYVIIALAGVVGDVATSDFAMNLASSVFDAPRGGESDTALNNAINQSAKWLTRNSGHSRFVFWKSGPIGLTSKEAKTMLRRLFEEYFQYARKVVA